MCDAYHYPHRKGSGRCGNTDAQEAFVHGPIPADPNARGAAYPSVAPREDSFAAWVDTLTADAAE